MDIRIKRFFDKFVIRTALLSKEELEDFLENPDVTKYLEKNSDFQKALQLSNPSLYAKLQQRPNDVEIHDTIYKYITRAASRATPLNLFSGIGLGRFEHLANMRLTRADEKYITWDLSYLEMLNRQKKSDSYMLNNTVQLFKSRVSYYESSLNSKGEVSYHGAVVDLPTKLIEIISFFQKHQGPVTRKQIARKFANWSDAGVSALENLQIIYPCQSFSWASKKSWASQCGIKTPNKPSPWSQLQIEQPISHNKSFNLFRSHKMAFLDEQTKRRLLSGVNALVKISWRRSRIVKISPMIEAIKAQLHRLEVESIPLLEAFDAYKGLLRLEELDALSSDQSIPLRELDYYLLEKYLNLKSSPANSSWSWDITEKELHELYRIDQKLPQSTTQNLRTLNVVASKIDGENESFNIEYLAGPSALNLLARFAHHHKEVEDLCEEIAQTEKMLNSPKLYAEILHQPFKGAEDVSLRPNFFDYYIPIFPKSNLADKKEITLNDLEIRVSGTRLMIWSKQLGEEILPRLTNAVTIDRDAFVLFRFLAKVAFHEETTFCGWSWRNLQYAPHLPRVTYKGNVLSPETWTINPRGIDSLKEVLHNNSALADFLKSRSFPKWVNYRTMYGNFLISLESDICLGFLSKEILRVSKSNEILQFQEVFSHKKSSEMTHELVFPTEVDHLQDLPRTEVTQKKYVSNGHRKKIKNLNNVIYLKLYLNPKAASDVLIDYFLPELKSLPLTWFFIRYTDPDFHLRLRIFPKNDKQNTQLRNKMVSLCNRLISEGLLHNYSDGFFKPELQRYGGTTGISLFLKNSHQDSREIASILADYQLLNEEEQFIVQFTNVVSYIRAFAAHTHTELELAERVAEAGLRITPEYSRLYKKHESCLLSLVQNKDCSSLSSDVNRIVRTIKGRVRADNIKNQDAQILRSYIHLSMNRLGSEISLNQENQVIKLVERALRTLSKNETLKYKSKT